MEMTKTEVKTVDRAKSAPVPGSSKIGPSSSLNTPVEYILFLQRTIGNRAVADLLKGSVVPPKPGFKQPEARREPGTERIPERKPERVPEREVVAPEPTAPSTSTPAPTKTVVKAEELKPKSTAEEEKSETIAADEETAPAPKAVKIAGPTEPAVELHIPEPPSKISPVTARRISGVRSRAGKQSAAQAALPTAVSQVDEARRAVTEPDAEAVAKAQAELMSQVQAAPSPEIIKLCERIREVIRKKRPPDEDALMEAKPEAEALNAGNQLNSTVQSETAKVQGNYGPLNNPPAPSAPVKGQNLSPDPVAAETTAVNAKAATPDAVPPENVSLDADVADSKKRMQDAGMDTPAAHLVESGPLAEARGAQVELEQTAKEDPAKVLAGQKAVLTKAEGDMAALRANALAALTISRAGTVKGTSSRKLKMVSSEEAMRAKAGAEAKKTFDDAKNQVNALLQPLASNAMAEWEAAKEVLVSQFKADLAIVQKRVDERHAGVGGFFVGLWDAVTGLPDWAEDAYTKAEKNFGDGVIAKLTAISAKVNSVIATCDLIIKNARTRIAKIFSDEMPASLKDWAAQEQAKFDGQLDQLHNRVIAARDSFNKDLVERSSQAVDEVRTEIAELRKKAGGLVGRIVSAVNRFLEDPVKFIIEGLLDLLGIAPASFWAVVAKIKKVVKDIADDPMKFADNLLAGLGKGFSQFFDNILSHLLKGFLNWLTGGLSSVGVQLPKDLSLKSIMTFFLQLMGITWPRIRKILAKHVGEKNVALLEKVYSLVSFLIEKGPEGIYEMIKEKLDPQSIVDQVVELAVDFLISAVIKAVSARIILLFNPVGAILQALEAIYRVLKWIFQNAARIFTLIETVVNGITDILTGNIGGFATAVEKALGMLIAPVISFLADYLGFGDLPGKIAEKIKSFQEWVLGLIEKALVWIIEKGKALLAAMGIGGKKDDKKKGVVDEDIGEKAMFVVDNESHSVWIEAAGTAVEVFVSSKKEPVESLLKTLETKAATLKGKKKAKADALLAEARAALGKTKNEGSKAKSAKDQAKAAPEDQQKVEAAMSTDDAAASEERALGTVLKDLFKVVGLSKADQKIAVYRLILGIAGLDADEFEENNEGITKDADVYRRTSRTAIVEFVPNIDSMSSFLRASAPVIPQEYSKVRSQIFEEWVRSYINVSGPGPQFISPHVNPKAPVNLKKIKFHGKDKRDSDGFSGTTLYEVKSHIAGGPGSDEIDQMIDYSQIIQYKLLDTNDQGPYTSVAYVFHDLDVQRKWTADLDRRLGRLHSKVTPTD